MYSEELLKQEDLQPFINQPETLINQTLEFQLQVANYLQTPHQLLEILANNSPHPLVVEAAKLHVDLVGEMVDNWQLVAENAIKNAPLAENDRLVAELLKIAPVPEYLISEWIPGNRLIEGLENPYLPQTDKIKLLERLAKSTIIEERLKAAAHPDTPREILEILAGDLELPIRIAVKYRDDSLEDVIEVIENQHEIAANWETLPQQLVELAGSRWSWIRQAVARNFYTPVEVLRELVGHKEEKIQLAIAKNLATPGEVLDLLVNHGFGEVTKSIAKHPNASEESLRKLIPRCKNYIKRRINLTSNILEAFAEQDNKEFNQLLINNPNTPTSALEKLIIFSNDSYSWAKLAEHPNAPVSILEQLAKHHYPWIRIDVYKNPNTPEYLKKKLFKELSNYQQVWEQLKKIKEEEESKQIRYYDDLTPEYFQKELLRDDDIPVEDYEIARHPNTPPYVLEILAINGYKSTVAENPNTPAYVLHNLSQNTDRHLRQYIAKNPSTPRYVLIELMNKPDFIYGDTYEDLSRLAYEYPNFPNKELYSLLLDKEITEEHQKARRFIAQNCNHITQFKEYAFQYGDTQARISLAGMSDTPLHILEKFVKDRDAKVRATVAENPNLPLDYLLELAKDSGVNVKRALVSSGYRENTPVEILEILKEDESEDIRVLVAGNRSATSEILNYLANDSSLQVRKKVGSNPNTSAETLELLWRTDKIFDVKNHNIPSHIVVEKIASTYNDKKLCKIIENGIGTYPQVTAKTLEKLSLHKNCIVRCDVAKHPNTPIHILEALADDNYSVTHWNLASNPNTPPHVLEYLLNNWEYCDGKYDYGLCCRLAENTNTPINTLEKLSQSSCYQVIKGVINNPKISLSTLKKFAQQNFSIKAITENEADVSDYQSDEYFLYQLSRNPKLTSEILEILANNVSREVRYSLIYHPNITTKIQTILANDEYTEIRQALAIRSNSAPEVLELLATDESPYVRKEVAQNINVSPSILETLALDISPDVRMFVAKNSNTPTTVLEQLAKDEVRKISSGVINNPNTPLNIKQALQYHLRVKISPTLKGLTRLYNPETDDLSTLLSEYVHSQVPFVRFISLMHPLIPIEFLQQGSQSLLWWERYAVAINSSTPLQIRERLTEDCNFIVKAAAHDS